MSDDDFNIFKKELWRLNEKENISRKVEKDLPE